MIACPSPLESKNWGAEAPRSEATEALFHLDRRPEQGKELSVAAKNFGCVNWQLLVLEKL